MITTDRNVNMSLYLEKKEKQFTENSLIIAALVECVYKFVTIYNSIMSLQNPSKRKQDE